MLPAIEKLLILQDRDRKIMRTQADLAGVEPQRQMLQAKLTDSSSHLEAVKTRAKQAESDRKKLELDAEAKKQLIDKYSIQQFQTKKNEEYRALAHEIETCKQAIVKLDDQQIEFMEKLDALQKEVVAAQAAANETRKLVEGQIAALSAKEENLRKHLAELQTGREQLAAEVGEDLLPRYERLRRNKGDTVVVGIEHSVCGGCHMKLPTQITVTCQSQQEIVSCPNCGRLLYFTRDMNLIFAD